MTIPLTRETIAAAYDYLRTTPPFCKWNLPEPEELRFKVARDPNTAGWHCHWRGKRRRLNHVIAVSEACIGHTDSLMALVAHECVHLHLAIAGIGRGEHGEAFNKLAKEVCKIHGFDPKAF